MHTDASVRFLLTVENFEDARIHQHYLLFFSSTTYIFSLFLHVYIYNLSCPVINVLDPNRLSPNILCERVSARCGGSANHTACYKVRKNDINTPYRSMRKKRRVKNIYCANLL